VVDQEHVVLAQPGADDHLPALRSMLPKATWSVLPTAAQGWALDPGVAPSVTVMFADHPPVNVAQMTALRWIQVGSHGYAQFNDVLLPPGTTVTNASGTNDLPIAQWCVMMLLALARDLPEMLRAQREHRWDRAITFQAELTGRRVGVLGYGNIGREVTQHLRALGLEVWVMSRSGAGDRGHRFDPLGRSADAWTAPDRAFTLDQAGEFYSGLDVLVVAVPITSATAGLVDARALSLLRPGALLLNPARAGVVDETALLAALRTGQIGGAALDDHYRQPMPPDDPFWDAPHTIVTAHISGSTGSTFYERRIWQLFTQNLQRLTEGAPLLNVIDRADLELADAKSPGAP
jgi:phosphoglycerate dehydrogenase-like enzyme